MSTNCRQATLAVLKSFIVKRLEDEGYIWPHTAGVELFWCASPKQTRGMVANIIKRFETEEPLNSMLAFLDASMELIAYINESPELDN